MPDFSERLKAERSRLQLSQAAMADAGGVGLNSQSNYENGHRSPDAAYLSRVAAIGVDVAYLLTGVRTPTPSGTGANDSTGAASDSMTRVVTREEAALLDNYEAADERGRAAARSVLDALAQPKAANG
jgi:transcriptional regulator with XRE-family HTH domain